VALLVKEVRAAMQKPEAVEAAKRAGYQIVAGTPDEMTKRLVSEIAGVKELVARAGIKPQ
jgi:tripartite-type tricarboxylate transporter receptor subunit TctC